MCAFVSPHRICNDVCKAGDLWSRCAGWHWHAAPALKSEMDDDDEADLARIAPMRVHAHVDCAVIYRC